MKQPTEHGMSAPTIVSTNQHTKSGSDGASNETDQIAREIQAHIGTKNFQHWLKNRARFELTADTLRIFVPNPFIASWLMKRFRSPFSRAAAALLGPSGTFELSIDEKLQTEESTRPSKPAADVTSSDTDPVSLRGGKRESPTHQSDGPQPLAVRRPRGRRFNSLSTLVTGECNDLAVMAARQVAEFPGERFNPLYIYGPTGTGKTHLLEAVYTETKRQQPDLTVMYITSESFTNYFTQALESRTVPSFRQRFRNVDVLLVDNIEFLGNKRATQEEFLHTVMQVVDHGGQLVVSGDRHPRLLTRHREELTTRLTSGLVCRVDAPCEEMRRRITAALALPMKDSFTREALDYVARRCRQNVREIQGALNCLHGHYTLDQRRITVTRAREILGDMQQECRRLVRISDVEKAICEAFGLTAGDLRSKSRRKAVSCPRSLAMFIARRLTKAAYREIGLYFGGRDHSTVVAAEKRVQAWIDKDSPLDLPSSCRARSISDVVQEIEDRLLSLAS